MAGQQASKHIEVAQGYVTIIPSLDGVQKKLDAELVPAATASGKKAGEAIEKAVSEGAGKGGKAAGDKVKESIPKAAETAGKDAGAKVADGLTQPIAKASDKVAKDVQAKMGDMAKGIGDKFRDFGSSLGSSMSMTKAMFGDAFGEIGSKLSGSKVGQAFSGIASSAKGAMSQVTGTVKGVTAFMGGAFAAASSKIGGALKTAGAIAKPAFEGIKGVASNVVGRVTDAFKGIASKLSGPLGAVGKVAAAAFKGAAAGIAGMTAAIGAIGKSAFDAYGNFEQLQGGVKLALGDDVWATVEKRSQSAFSNMQISQNDYLTKVSSMAVGLREALGGKGHEQEAADLADRVIKTQADIVSAMGITQEAADNAFNGIMKGNFTMLDNLGLGIKPTKEGMQEVIDKVNEWRVEQGKTGDLVIDNLADCQEALVEYTEHMGLSGYAMNEGADTVQGSVSKMKAAWTDWTAELGKSDGDMSRVTTNLSESVQDVARNALPVLSNAVSSIVGQLPTVITTVGPQLGQALQTIADSATGGLATKALEMVQPITDALSQAFGDGAAWFGDNAGVFGEIGDKLSDIGGKVSEGIGAAITTVSPIVGSFASGALTLLSSGLDFLSGALDAAAGLVTHLSTAFGPALEALSPLAQAVGDAANGAFQWLCDRLSGVGDALSNVDWDGWATTVSESVQGVVDFVNDRIEELKGFFQSIGDFINDPIGTIQSGLGELFGATSATSSQVQSNFSSMQSGVSVSAANMVGSIGRVNSAKLNSKTATIKGTGNAIDGTAVSKIGDTRTAITNLSGKTVSVNAEGNAVDGGAKSWIDRLRDSISSLTSKTVNVHTNYTSSGFGQKATGAIVRRFASGAIFTKPTMTDVGLIGEAGAEAVYSNGRDTGIFPLTNRRYTGPFAREIADQLRGTMPQGNNNTFYIDGAGDPEAVADAVARRLALLSA